jgi:6-phosphogluconolactonase
VRRLGAAVLLLGLAVLPASASAAAVYATNAGGSSVSQYTFGSGGLLSPLGAPAPAGAFTNQIAFTPDNHSAYATALTGDVVSQYDVAANGALTPKAPATVAVPSAWGIAVTPDGASVYVADVNDHRVYQFTVSANGALAPKAPAFVTVPNEPSGIAVNPDGKTAYALYGASGGAHFVQAFTIAANGTLSATGAPVAAGNGSTDVILSPDGKHGYVSAFNSGDVRQFDVAANGVFTAKTPPALVTGGFPQGVGITPDGTSLYVANRADDSIYQFDVDADGALTPKTIPKLTTPVAGASLRGVAVSTGGGSVYVGSGGLNRVWQLSVGAGGALAFKNPAFVAAGSAPFSVAAGPDQGPTAAFSQVIQPAGLPSSFDGSASSDPDDGVTRWDWDFGDGTSANDAGGTTTHTYAVAGTYTATLRVFDAGGCSTDTTYTGQSFTCRGTSAAVTTRTVTVSPPPPCACPLILPPGNSAFSILAVTATRAGTITALIQTEAGGDASAVASTKVRTGKKRKARRAARRSKVKTINYGAGSATALAGGRLTIRIPPGRAGAAALRRTRKLRVAVSITFQATNGPPETRSRSVTVKAAKKHRKR